MSYMNRIAVATMIACIATASCQTGNATKQTVETLKADSTGTDSSILNELAEPYATPSVKKHSKVVAWPANKMPSAPAEFTVSVFAKDLDNPRWIFVADNGDVFVTESNKTKSADRVTLFRDTTGDGAYDLRSVFIKDLNMPFGVYAKGNSFYVANTDGIMQYAYTPGNTEIKHKGKQIVSLPAGPQHWTRNIIGGPDGKLYVSVGSASNAGEGGMEREHRRACILQISANGLLEKVYASGLRNPVGMAFLPGTENLWTVVNERDELGDELVPDFLTSVQEGGFYGWPFSYFGAHPDPRLLKSKDSNRTELIGRAITPDLSLGAHTASLGLTFYNGNFPAKYSGGAFIGQHGSWNRSSFAGYKVVFVPFKNGKPAGAPEDFLSGFIADESKNQVYGRPAGVAVMKDGSLLIADDAGNKIWRVYYNR
jgi:glucose/arabinose dehydrogenase